MSAGVFGFEHEQRLRRDAARYRWLRTAGAWESEIGMDALSENPEAFDAAVDAAMNEVHYTLTDAGRAHLEGKL